MNTRKNKYLKYILILLAGIFLGWLFFRSPGRHEVASQSATPDDKTGEPIVWTCSMHPQIRKDKPGDCPICGMDLIPLGQVTGSSYDPDAIHLSKEAAMLANVMTSVVTRQKPEKKIRLYGKVSVDERLLQNVVAHVPGRIEKLNINFTGETVKKGQELAEIYSPELITAQQELLQTYKARQIQPELYDASKERLRQWKLTDSQIREIESSGKITSNIRVYSNISGTVTALNVNAGDYVSRGTVLFQVADLSKVWILFDAYESDLPFLEKGDNVTFTLQSIPGKEYKGNISFIDPVIDPVTRTARVRIEAGNSSGELKPEMFVNGIVASRMGNTGNDIVIPRSAVLWTGKRSIVYLKVPGDEYLFKMHEIELGPVLGDSYVVADGLSEGDVIVTNGTFSVDAAAQLEGKPSMMNQTGVTSMAGHDQENEIKTNAPAGNTIEIETDGKFNSRFKPVFEDYISLKNGLVKSDPAAAKKSAAKMAASLKKIDVNLLKGEAHNRWMSLVAGMNSSIDEILSTDSLEDQRAAFSDLSNKLYASLKTINTGKGTVYWQFCPMAFENKGAFWLSESEDIRNPYFGEDMLTCGETKATIKF